MIAYTPHGFPRPVGSEFRQREVYAPRGLGDAHNVPWVVSVVDVVGGTFIEAKNHTAIEAVVVDDLHNHSQFVPDILEAVKPLLNEAGWWVYKVMPCSVSGCSNPRPMWSRRDSEGECLTCEARSVLACVECGGPDPAHYAQREAMLRGQLCFTCHLWTDRVNSFGTGSATASLRIVDDRWRYQSIRTPGFSGGSSSMKGYGGARWKITFNGGLVMTTDDLWDGGEVPEWFRDRLPQTAMVESVPRG